MKTPDANIPTNASTAPSMPVGLMPQRSDTILDNIHMKYVKPVHTEVTHAGSERNRKYMFIVKISRYPVLIINDFNHMGTLSALRSLFIGPILDDRLKEKLLKPWKGAFCSHFRVCLCVCLSVRSRRTPFDLGTYFLGQVILETWEINAFFVFRKFHFYAFYRHFSIFFFI